MWPFKKSKETPADKQMLDWLSIESVTYNKEDGTNITADITRSDIKAWLYAVSRTIQKSMEKVPVIKNWLCGTLIVADQEIEFYIMKKGGNSPLKMIKEKDAKIKELEKKLEDALLMHTQTH